MEYQSWFQSDGIKVEGFIVRVKLAIHLIDKVNRTYQNFWMKIKFPE